MSNSTKDMYLFSRRNHDRYSCLLYATRLAARRHGPLKAHIHSDDCNHLQACKECKFNVSHELDKDIWKYCGIGILMLSGCTFTEAYQVARDLKKHAPGGD